VSLNQVLVSFCLVCVCVFCVVAEVSVVGCSCVTGTDIS